jgi:hypothetical protein
MRQHLYRRADLPERELRLPRHGSDAVRRHLLWRGLLQRHLLSDRLYLLHHSRSLPSQLHLLQRLVLRRSDQRELQLRRLRLHLHRRNGLLEQQVRMLEHQPLSGPVQRDVHQLQHRSEALRELRQFLQPGRDLP